MNRLQTIFPSSTKSTDTKAKIVDHTLVATFRASNPPVVWRMDLEKNHSFSLAIQKATGTWDLGIMSPKGEFAVVTRFDDRRAADEALATVESAMFNTVFGGGGESDKIMRIGAWIAGGLVVIILISMVIGGLRGGSSSAAPAQSAAKPAAAAIKQGVPQDADAVLNMQLGK